MPTSKASRVLPEGEGTRSRVGDADSDVDASTVFKMAKNKLLLRQQIADRRNPIERVGTLSFPTSSTRPSKWARIHNDNSPEKINRLRDELFQGAWKLDHPTVLISVHGSVNDEDLCDVADELKRGLIDAVATTGAWVTTSGIRAGVSRLVGSALATVAHKEVPCVGFCGWHSVVGHDALNELENGMTFRYTYDHDQNNARIARQATDHDDENSMLLEVHHTHFVFMDEALSVSGNVRAGAADVRSAMEEALCPDHVKKPDTTGLAEEDLDDDEDHIAVPKVVLVAGGGFGALRAVHTAVILHDRPVVVLCDVPGASSWIHAACAGASVLPALDGVVVKFINAIEVAGSVANDIVVSGPKRQTAAARIQAAARRFIIAPLRRRMLADIAAAYRKADAEGDRALHFFSLVANGSRHSASDVLYYGAGELHTCIVNALLRDCASTCENQMDAVQLAVSWGHAHLVRTELEEFRKASFGKDGLMRALERALSTADAATLKVLLDFNATPEKVRLDELVRPGSAALRLDVYDKLKASESHRNAEQEAEAAAPAAAAPLSRHEDDRQSMGLTLASEAVASISDGVNTVASALSRRSQSMVLSTGVIPIADRIRLKDKGMDKERRGSVKKWLQEIHDERDGFDISPESVVG
jgi:hypothetical protein